MKQQPRHHQLEVVLRFKSWQGLVLGEATFYKVGEPSCHVQIVDYWPNGSINQKVNYSLQEYIEEAYKILQEKANETRP